MIPAHNESAGIKRCLDALCTSVPPGQLDVVVACNGCTDDTAAVARSSGHPVRVIELEVGSKPAALRAGDDLARAFPRLYLDADVLLDGSAALAVLERLTTGAIAARPPIRYDSSASSRSVRSYYRARARLPALDRSLWGAGVYGLSRAGRSRFDAFPDIVADDLWVDRHFTAAEVEIVHCPPVVIRVPRRARDLIRVLQRTYRGKAEIARHDPNERGRATTRSTLRELRGLARAGPRRAIDAAAYAAFVLSARIVLAVRPPTDRWERDDSSRTP